MAATPRLCVARFSRGLLLLVLALSSTAGGSKPRDLYVHQHIPFPKLRLVAQQRTFSSTVCKLPLEIECNSLLGPECSLYSTPFRGVKDSTTSPKRTDGDLTRAAREKASWSAPAGPGEGIMEQYMEASQRLLSSVQSDSWGSAEDRRRDGTGGQRLDDVVIVKVGRSVKSVYDEENDEDRLKQATGTEERPGQSDMEAAAEHSRGEDLGRAEAEFGNAEKGEQCESGLVDGTEGTDTSEGPLSALKDLDTTRQLQQTDAEDMLQEQEYYDHCFNSSILNPDDEYYPEYDDMYYLPED